MKIAIRDKQTHYLFNNENLKKGDKVFPLTHGYINDNEYYIYKIIDISSVMTGWPNDPHTILDMNHSSNKGYQVRTDKGYGPIECYFKFIGSKP